MSALKWIDIPPVWLCLMILLAWCQKTFAGISVQDVPLGISVLGNLLFVIGLGLIATAAWAMFRHRTTIIPHLEPDRLVESGVFALSRNPIYLGDLCILAGLVLYWGAYPALVLVPVLLWIIERRFILAEEARLARAFGPAFEAYRNRTRRWL